GVEDGGVIASRATGYGGPSICTSFASEAREPAAGPGKDWQPSASTACRPGPAETNEMVSPAAMTARGIAPMRTRLGFGWEAEVQPNSKKRNSPDETAHRRAAADAHAHCGVRRGPQDRS